MNKLDKIEDFLKLIAEASRNGIKIDYNLVYSNLIRMNTSPETIRNYFGDWTDKYIRNRHIDVFEKGNYCHFKSLTSKSPTNKKIKMYISLDKSHVYNGVNQLVEFLSMNNLGYEIKVSDSTRLDSVVLIVDDELTAKRVAAYIKSNQYIQEGLTDENPFMFDEDGVSYAWDDNLSYNVVVSEYIADYINSMYDRLDEVTYGNFCMYVLTKYKEVFKNGNGITDFMQSREGVMYPAKLASYQSITEMILMAITPNSTTEEFYRYYRNASDNEKTNQKVEILNGFVLNENIDTNKLAYTPEQKEAFDYALLTISKKDSPEYAVKVFEAFCNDKDYYGNYRIFTNTGNVRYQMTTNRVTPYVMREMLFEEKKNALEQAMKKTSMVHGVLTAARALFELKGLGSYDSFTNQDNSRNDLKLFVKKEQLDDLIHEILKRSGYEDKKSDSEYWVYIEMIEKELEKANTK